jgi:photosystem II stability/assembly factor-like uncharacterized protein
MEPDEDFLSPLERGRAKRALALMAVSVLAIGVAALAFAEPKLSFGPASHHASQPRHAPEANYQLAAIHFVDPSTGWVVAELPSHEFVVLHTTNTGKSWTRQLTGASGDIGEYAYFDRNQGVVVTLGPLAFIFQSSDGGQTWTGNEISEGGGHVISADFADARDGWLLVQTSGSPTGPPAETLYRTRNAGSTWLPLYDPVPPGEWAYRTAFADAENGWLYSLSSAPYAYRTADGGDTWQRVALPAPRVGWPTAPVGSSVPEEFFVAARPTIGAGVAATVVPIAPPKGKSADGETLLGYPPLTIQAFDGGGAVTYVYTTYADWSQYRYTNILSGTGQVIAPIATGQVELSSLDGGSSWWNADVPSAYGALGVTDARDWWWIGEGAWATSSDAGITWSSIRSLKVLAPLPGSLQILDPDHAWFAAYVGSRPVLELTSDGGHEWTAVPLPRIATP